MSELPEAQAPLKSKRTRSRLALGTLLVLLVAIPIVAWLRLEKREAGPFLFRAARNVEGRVGLREHQERVEEVLREIGPIELEKSTDEMPLPPLPLPDVPVYPEAKQ